MDVVIFYFLQIALFALRLFSVAINKYGWIGYMAKFGRILDIEIIRSNIRLFNLLYLTTKIPLNKQAKV